MKKRMFLSTILMTLVLLVALTTATFAWYEVSSTGKTAALNTPDATVSTVAGTFEAAEVTLDGTITAEQAVALTGADGVSYVLANGQKVAAANDSTINKVGVATLSISWPTSVTNLPEADEKAIYAAYAGSYLVTITGNELRFFDIAEDVTDVEPTAKDVKDLSIVLSVTLNNDGTITIENAGKFYFAVTGLETVEKDVVKTIKATMTKAK